MVTDAFLTVRVEKEQAIQDGERVSKHLSKGAPWGWQERSTCSSDVDLVAPEFSKGETGERITLRWVGHLPQTQNLGYSWENWGPEEQGD